MNRVPVRSSIRLRYSKLNRIQNLCYAKNCKPNRTEKDIFLILLEINITIHHLFQFDRLISNDCHPKLGGNRRLSLLII